MAPDSACIRWLGGVPVQAANYGSGYLAGTKCPVARKHHQPAANRQGDERMSIAEFHAHKAHKRPATEGDTAGPRRRPAFIGSGPRHPRGSRQSLCAAIFSVSRFSAPTRAAAASQLFQESLSCTRGAARISRGVRGRRPSRKCGATPTQEFAFPSIVVASTDDPYGTIDHSTSLARAWGSRLASIGACGHINGSSGLGDWPDGYELLAQLRG